MSELRRGLQIGKVRVVREALVPQLIGGGSAQIGSELGKRARPERWPSFRFGRAARAWRSASRSPSHPARSRLRTQRNRTPPADNAREARSAARLWGNVSGRTDHKEPNDDRTGESALHDLLARRGQRRGAKNLADGPTACAILRSRVRPGAVQRSPPGRELSTTAWRKSTARCARRSPTIASARSSELPTPRRRRGW
jgi:hypothetical protein